ncbi:hypothetical protein ACI2IP_12005 [Microbacterium sp. NPDC090218]
MKTWSYFVLGAILMAGAGVYMLRTDSVEWWSVVSATVMFAASATFLGRAVVEYRRRGEQR